MYTLGANVSRGCPPPGYFGSPHIHFAPRRADSTGTGLKMPDYLECRGAAERLRTYGAGQARFDLKSHRYVSLGGSAYLGAPTPRRLRMPGGLPRCGRNCVYLRPKLKKPPFEDSDFGCPSHHCPLGTLALTAATCCPQPLHVVLPQVLHLTGEHIVFQSFVVTLLLC